jgi:hypothetical protein
VPILSWETLYQDSDVCRHINNILIAVSLAPGGASAKHGKIAPQQMQEFIGGAIQTGTIL